MALALSLPLLLLSSLKFSSGCSENLFFQFSLFKFCFFSGTALGYYMYVEASQGRIRDMAQLESPWLKQSASTCVVSFWYHMYGRGIGTLYGYIKVGLTYTRLFEQSGNKGKTK